VSGEGADDRILAGHRPRLNKSGRAQHSVAVVRLHPAAVGVHGPQALDGDRRAVHVLPARVENAAVGHHRGGEIVDVVRRQPPLALAVPGHPVEHSRRSDKAHGELPIAGGDVDDIAVRQPACVIVVPGAVGELGESGPVHVHAVDVVTVLWGAPPTEHDFLGVEGKIVVQQLAFRRCQYLRELALGRGRGEHVQTASGPEALAVHGVHVGWIQLEAPDHQHAVEPQAAISDQPRQFRALLGLSPAVGEERWQPLQVGRGVQHLDFLGAGVRAAVGTQEPQLKPAGGAHRVQDEHLGPAAPQKCALQGWLLVIPHPQFVVPEPLLQHHRGAREVDDRGHPNRCVPFQHEVRLAACLLAAHRPGAPIVAQAQRLRNPAVRGKRGAVVVGVLGCGADPGACGVVGWHAFEPGEGIIRRALGVHLDLRRAAVHAAVRAQELKPDSLRLRARDGHALGTGVHLELSARYGFRSLVQIDFVFTPAFLNQPRGAPVVYDLGHIHWLVPFQDKGGPVARLRTVHRPGAADIILAQEFGDHAIHGPPGSIRG